MYYAKLVITNDGLRYVNGLPWVKLEAEDLEQAIIESKEFFKVNANVKLVRIGQSRINKLDLVNPIGWVNQDGTFER